MGEGCDGAEAAFGFAGGCAGCEEDEADSVGVIVTSAVQKGFCLGGSSLEGCCELYDSCPRWRCRSIQY